MRVCVRSFFFSVFGFVFRAMEENGATLKAQFTAAHNVLIVAVDPASVARALGCASVRQFVQLLDQKLTDAPHHPIRLLLGQSCRSLQKLAAKHRGAYYHLRVRQLEVPLCHETYALDARTVWTVERFHLPEMPFGTPQQLPTLSAAGLVYFEEAERLWQASKEVPLVFTSPDAMQKRLDELHANRDVVASLDALQGPLEYNRELFNRLSPEKFEQINHIDMLANQELFLHLLPGLTPGKVVLITNGRCLGEFDSVRAAREFGRTDGKLPFPFALFIDEVG